MRYMQDRVSVVARHATVKRLGCKGFSCVMVFDGIRYCDLAGML